MTQNLLNVLIITGLGMGLVFSALGLLWAVISIMVRLLAERPVAAPAPEPAAEPALLDQAVQARKQRATAAAVAVALALARQAEAAHAAVHGAPVSPWQTIMRGKQIRERGRVR